MTWEEQLDEFRQRLDNGEDPELIAAAARIGRLLAGGAG